ncbi:unnamed protein product, partial [Prunus brigantina]
LRSSLSLLPCVGHPLNILRPLGLEVDHSRACQHLSLAMLVAFADDISSVGVANQPPYQLKGVVLSGWPAGAVHWLNLERMLLYGPKWVWTLDCTPSLECMLVCGPNLKQRLILLWSRLIDARDIPAC